MFTEEGRGPEDKRSRSKHLYRTKGLTGRLYYCIRRRLTRTKAYKDELVVGQRYDDLVLFRWQFVSTAIFVRLANFEARQLSKILSLSLLDRRVFGQGTESLAGLGLDSNNFVVAQPTTYFEDYPLRRLPTSKSLVFRPTPKKTSYCETVPWC